MIRSLETTLGDVCDFIGGSQPAKKYFSDTNLKDYIRLIQIRDYKTDNYITFIPKNSTRKFCNKNDIMIGRYGPPIFQILRGLEGAYNVALMKAKPKENIINDYLYYFLRQEHLFDYINALSPRTGGQTGVDVVMLKKFPILLPELSSQKQIAKILSDLDAKIEINNKINQELEAMAKAIYDYWFVQFDFSNANGKPYKSSGGKMVYNEELKREIPEGWKVNELSEISELKAGGDKPKTFTKEKTLENSIPIYSNGITNEGLYGFTNIAKINKESITVSARGTIGYCVLRKNPFVPIIRLISVTPFNSNEVIYLFESIKNLVFENSGSVQQQLTVPQISKLKVVYPPKYLLEKYNSLTTFNIDKIEINKEENQKLAELRDWLLPMLMNGQVTVGEAEEQINMAVEAKGK